MTNRLQPVTMKLTATIVILISFYVLIGCSGNGLEEKGFAVRPANENGEENKVDGISKDSLNLMTKPSNVLLTGIPRYRLTTIYKVNYNRDSTSFIGSNDFHYNYGDIGTTQGNQWNYNLVPGLEAVYGYNMVNVSHYDTETQKRKDFFANPVLIKTLYYPSFSKDTLNHSAVIRNYFLASVYDDDTNKDGFINVRDLRRFYYFDVNAENKRPLIPKNYSVYKSEYDPANDFMYVFAQLDGNGNGNTEDGEDVHIFWIDLKNPEKTGRHY